MYIWQQENWPNLTWDSGRLAVLLAQVAREQGRLLGKMESLGFDLRREAQLSILTGDVVRSGQDRRRETRYQGQVRSSIARQLGMEVGGLAPGWTAMSRVSSR